MSKTDQSTLPSGLAGGRLEGISVPELLWGISLSEKTGVMRVVHGDVTKRVYIEEGRIVFATSSDTDDRLGETLLREDLITLDQLQRAAGRFGTGKRLGTILVEIAAITPQDLVNGVIAQVKDIIMSLFPLEEGEYRFEEGALPTEELITVKMKMEELLLQGIRQVRSFSRIRRSVGPPRTLYRLTAGPERSAEMLDLNEGETTLLRHLDAEGRTVEELCQKVFLSNFEIYQALWAFKVLGLISAAERGANSPEAAAIEGHLGPGGVGPVLVRLCRDGETGVLYISHDAVDRAVHLREGRCIFATSSNIDDGLLAHLLRRGVISLRDREETARRLLSNKRVGTILREMGVIDEYDLAEMVKEQIAEVLFDTFRWDRGEFAFVPGELPTIEEIVLESSIEDIAQRGIARVTSWSRVMHGIGGLETRLVLSNDYLETLDRMNVGQEEWEVVAALRAPKTVSEICRESSLGDFRVCQILWAFNLIGVATVEATAGVEVETEQDPPAPIETEDTEPLVAEAVIAAAPVEIVEGAGSAETIVIEALEDDEHVRDARLEETEVETPSEAARVPEDDDEASLEANEPEEEPVESIVEPDVTFPEWQTDEALTAEPADPDESYDDGGPVVPEEEDDANDGLEVVSDPVLVQDGIPTEPFYAETASAAARDTSGPTWELDEPVASDEPSAGPEEEPSEDWPEREAFEVASEPESSPSVDEPESEDTVAVDSPVDTTRYFPREEVEAMLETEPTVAEPPPFMITDPAEMMMDSEGEAADPEGESDPGERTVRLSRQEVEAALEAEAIRHQAETVVEVEEPQESTEPEPIGSDAVEELEEFTEPEPTWPDAAEEPEESTESEKTCLVAVEEPAESTEAELECSDGVEEPEESTEPELESSDVVEETEEVTDPEPTGSSDVDEEPESLVAEEYGGGNGNHDDGWIPPEDLEPQISRFNAMQRIVYRSIRSEVGAGAANFVKSCGGSVEDRFGDLFEAVDLQADGAWDPGELREALVERRVEDPWDGFRKLLDEEIDKLRVHIGEARASSLQERLSGVENQEPAS